MRVKCTALFTTKYSHCPTIASCTRATTIRDLLQTATSVAEEKALNPRLGGQLTERDFIGFMDNLGLDHPKKINIAVPSYMKCGRPDDQSINKDNTNWAELTLTFAGFWEVQPYWLAETRK